MPQQPHALQRIRTSLAGHGIDIELPPEAGHLAHAFARRDGEPGIPADLTVSVRIDRAAVDEALRDVTQASQHRRQGDAHLWLAPNPRHVQSLVLSTPGACNTAKAGVVLDRAQELDGSLRARPGADAISAWAANRGVLPIHAAGIAREGRALLLLGDSGSGKTTTALALAERGWNLVGDDRCFLYRDAAGTRVASLYATAVVTAASLLRLQARDWQDIGGTHHGKYARLLPPAITMAHEAGLAGVVWVSPRAGRLYEPEAMTRREALVPWQAALAPLLQAHGPSAGWVRQLARLSSEVPTWRMRIGWDFARIDAALDQLLAEQGGVA